MSSPSPAMVNYLSPFINEYSECIGTGGNSANVIRIGIYGVDSCLFLPPHTVTLNVLHNETTTRVLEYCCNSFSETLGSMMHVSYNDKKSAYCVARCFNVTNSDSNYMIYIISAVVIVALAVFILKK